MFFFGDDVSDVVDNADVIVADDAQGDAILRRAFSAPLSFDDAIAEASAQFGCVGTVGTVDFDASADGDDPEDVSALDGAAALCQ